MNGYGIGLAAALAMCAGLVLLLTRRGPGLHRGLLLCGVSAAGGLLAARLVYWLGAADFFIGRVHSAGSFSGGQTGDSPSSGQWPARSARHGLPAGG